VACGTEKTQDAKAPLTQQDRVIDRANMISEVAEDSIYNLIQDLENDVGPQIAVLTIDTLNGETINSFSMKSAEQMRLGRGKYHDGVLMTFSLRDRSMRIEVGSGLENILKDEIAMRISRDIIAPKFREKKYGQGIYLGVKEIKDLIEHNKELVGKVAD
jgi:uncharacterized membrane protein YgcG